MNKFFRIMMLITLILASFVSAVLAKNDQTNFSAYLGNWYASQTAKSYDEVFTKGGAALEITSVKGSYVEGAYMVISASPANQSADFEFKGTIKNNQLKFKFEDSFLNTGNATFKFKPKRIEVVIDQLKISDENPSGWSVSDAIFVKKSK